MSDFGLVFFLSVGFSDKVVVGCCGVIVLYKDGALGELIYRRRGKHVASVFTYVLSMVKY